MYIIYIPVILSNQCYYIISKIVFCTQYLYIYIYVYIYIYMYILKEEQSLCFLKTLQNIHLGQLRITFSSPFCVAGVVGQLLPSFKCIIYIYKILKLLEGGNATGVRQSSMLGFYGERVCRRRNQTCSLWEAQQAQLLSHRCLYIYIYTLFK